MYTLVLLSGYDVLCIFFFFNDTATTEIYTLSLHDALPISGLLLRVRDVEDLHAVQPVGGELPHRVFGLLDVPVRVRDRKSTRLNSSHANISYAVFCLKKKKHKLSSSVY